MKVMVNSMYTLVDYLSFAKSHPALFANPTNEGITILLGKDEISEIEAIMMMKLASMGMPKEWARIGIVYQDQHLFILRDAVRFPDGSLGTYMRLVDKEDSSPGVAILSLWQGRVILLRHFRHATRTWHLEIPRGTGEKGLSAEENARKELTEEIGASLSSLVSLGKIYPDTGKSSECDELFYADVESYGNIKSQEAIIEMLAVSVLEFDRMIRENEINDSFTLAAYARAKLYGLL